MDREQAQLILDEAQRTEELAHSPLTARLALLATFDPLLLAGDDTGDVVRLLCRRLPRHDGRQAAMLDERWRIEAIAAMLRAGGLAELARVRASAEAHHDTPLQRMMDAFVRGEALPVDMNDQNDLLAALEAWRWASEAVARAQLTSAVPIEPARDVIESRLALLDVTRAVRGLADAGCVGRERELTRLSAYRMPSTARRSLVDEPAMVVHGIGGIGKSTLVARFVMDLHDAAERGERLAWAYLDLDRPTLESGDPAVVLADVIRQITAQFPDQRRVLARSKDVAHRKTKGAGLEASDTAVSYRQRVADFASAMQAAGVDSLVIVLDTFEELERNHPDRVADLYDLFAAWASELPTFRLVVSGRRPAAAFVDPLRADRRMHVLPLGHDAAVTLLHSFVDRSPPVATRPSPHRIDDALAREVIGLVGRIPLTVRLAADVLVREGVAAVADAANRARAMDRVRSEVVRGFLYQRILDHVTARDPRRTAGLRQVARAGLVLRWITPALVERVLLPVVDAAVAFPATEAFDELGSEVALVEHDGGVLRLREELRGPALAALRMDDHRLVERVHERAARYFAAQIVAGQAGPEAEVELAYHRVALGDPVTGFDAAVLRGLEPSVADLPAASARLIRRALRDPAALPTARDIAVQERIQLAEADAALRNDEPERAREVLARSDQRSEGTELYRLESRLEESLGDLAAADAATRRDLDAAMAASAHTRVAAAGVRLARLLERQGRAREAEAVLQETADAPLLLGHPELRLELLLNLLNVLERAHHPDDRLRWTLGLDVRALVQRIGPRTVASHTALARLLAAALGREEPDRIRHAARLVGLGHEEDSRRVDELVAELAAWDAAPPEPGRVARQCGLRVESADADAIRRAWATLSGLGTDAGLLLDLMWSAAPPEPVREALRRVYLWWDVESGSDDDRVDSPHADFIAERRIDWSRPEVRALEDIVLTAYPSPTDVRTLADRAGFAPGAISWTSSVRRITRELIGNAVRSERLGELVEAILTDPATTAVHDRVRGLVGPGWSQARDHAAPDDEPMPRRP
ncbi:ATP-binding protein [Pseudonocardia sp. DSM 110487]|uniref:AAA family ATPase n=1 Tax=Pseudonocardia sp. DSM 110487 TaxID=2865833 RepID=UPI001C6A326F|nr:AAA family ATPase [Pseudonocardia sp. DSM 110487]QYN39135.1 ATP-binding protein [Pseudonocardia sp. DSM 110487]